MHKRIFAALFLVLAAAVILKIYKHERHVHVYSGDSFNIAKTVKNLALLGCTPHPTNFIKENGYNLADLKKLKLQDFIDLNDLEDSYTQVFELCKNNKVDHLLIAYLPAYFIEFRRLTGSEFMIACRAFLDAIAPQIEAFLKALIEKQKFKVSITLILPTDNALKFVPNESLEDKERIRYLIKQFPHINNLNSSDIDTITIINNQNSGQNESIIDYLKYEYLYCKKLNFKILETNKNKFHKYINLIGKIS